MTGKAEQAAEEIPAHFDSAAYQQALLAWQYHHGRHHLPWQCHDPYAVWVSEIMLQQTRVATVIPYYQAFMQRFGDVFALAAAEQETVMRYWAGLGYYARGRNLHKAALKIVTEWGGRFPCTQAGWQQLPGVGRSTAAAIQSLCYDAPTPIMDGNVRRIFARLFALAAPVDQRDTEKWLWQRAEQLMPATRCGQYTQALMDLGSLVCTRRHPACHCCPLVAMCQGAASGNPEAFPRKTRRAARPERSSVFYLCEYQGQVLLQKRPQQGIWGGLYSLPESLPEADKAFAGVLCRDARHTFTHYILHYAVEYYQLEQPPAACDSSQCWVSWSQLPLYPMPAPLARLLGPFADA